MITTKQAIDHAHTHAQNRFAVIPVAERLAADTTRTSRGVTIAILDSGFYPHPDLTEPRNRIVAFHDVTNPKAKLDASVPPQSWDWHGTQTSVTAAGNGFLSEGVYRGLASAANVVLVKVSNAGRIKDENIVSGLEWVIANKDRYGIRVVSMSLGGDADVSFQESLVDEAAERAVRAGLTLVVAAGNSGCTDEHRPIPPANSPSVITVGGYSDNNELGARKVDPYCSSFGPTIDGVLKPEIVAPAIWVAAPILPETDFYRRAEALSIIAAAPDYQMQKLAGEFWREAAWPQSMASASPTEIRELAETGLRESKVVATHYQHVDGTSFAAPIVASVVAQMIEANPQLTPAAVKNILVATADRSANLSLHQQGYGILNARRAVVEAASEIHTHEECDFNAPRVENGNLVFWFHDDSAKSVSLAGDFNDWNPQATFFAKHQSGMWRAEINALSTGSYEYKLVVDGKWLDDPSNGLKVSDNHGSFNSVLNIAE
ncbi:MAG: S8 family serine peptidase [Acidobacteriota bacterium]|nr:S8 family serine peptidase [Acidobacteriota bacterium]